MSLGTATAGQQSRWVSDCCCDAPDTASNGKEAVDRRSLTLEQEELVKQVYAANSHTFVVLIASFPYAINWTQQNIPAIVHMTHNSEELGNALADVLFGDYNPGGKLVHTSPKSLDQLPEMMDYDLRHGRTYMYSKADPLYPFGYGLSYTTFALSNLRASRPQISHDGATSVKVDVQNTGNVTGDEVVQLYLSYPGSKVDRPIKQLKGFRRVTLQSNQKQTVELPLTTDAVAYWDIKLNKFVVEPGTVKVMVGNSSANLPLEITLTVAAE